MKPPSFIESFVKYCEGTPTPELFAKWAAISALSGALERRVWAMTRNTQLIPNLIVLLVSPPGIGKTRVITETHEMWLEAGMFNVSPTTVTRAALIDQLAEKKIVRNIKTPDGKLTGSIFEYRSILVAAPEFGVFCPKHDLEFLNTINDLFDCRKNFIERRRCLKDVIDIPRPHITILGGTQPSFLGELLPDAAFGMGFTARCLMIYQGTGPQVPIFTSAVNRKPEFARLVLHLKKVSELFGQMTWTDEVQLELQDFVTSGMEPRPDHMRLTNYNTRRDLHLLKLCMISAASDLRMEVQSSDFLWAADTLLEAEQYMPDIFKDMFASPDNQIVADVLTFIKTLYVKKQQPVSQSRVVNFVASRVPSNRVLDIIGIMVKGDLIEEQVHPNGLRFYAPMTPKND